LSIVATICVAVASFLEVLVFEPGQWAKAVTVGIGAGLSAAQSWHLLPNKVKAPIKKKLESKVTKVT
jgi:hypothetical protein